MNLKTEKKKTSYNDIFLYNYISVYHSLWNRSDLFPTSLLSLHFNKRKKHWEKLGPESIHWICQAIYPEFKKEMSQKQTGGTN